MNSFNIRWNPKRRVCRVVAMMVVGQKNVRDAIWIDVRNSRSQACSRSDLVHRSAAEAGDVDKFSLRVSDEIPGNDVAGGAVRVQRNQGWPKAELPVQDA